MNLSIKDISLFLEIISKYRSIGYEVNDGMAFQEFDELRKIDNAAYSFGTLALDEFLSSKNSFVAKIANMGIYFLEKSSFAKKKIVENATGAKHFKSL